VLTLQAAVAVDPSRRISQYGHTAWRVYDGAIPRVSSLTQTNDGYMWLSTPDGLYRFDGVRFTQWRSPDGKPVNKRLSALLGAKDGSLWIGSLNGLQRFNHGRLYTYAKPNEIAAIGTIFEASDGSVWVTRYGKKLRSGPLCRAGDTELVCYGPKDGLPVAYALGIAQDTEGFLWFGSNVLCRWKPGTQTCFEDLAKDLPGAGVVDVARGPAGSVWAAIDFVGAKGGIRYYSDGKWNPYIVPGFNGPAERSHGMYVDRENALWIGTENNGIYRIYNGVADHYGSADGLTGNSASGLYEDREKNLWVVTDSGIDMFRDTPVVSYTMAQGLFGTTISSILPRRDGSVWVANQGAIDILRDGQHSMLSGRDLPGEDAWAMFEDHTQTVWVGLDSKLFTYEANRFSEVKRPDGSPMDGKGHVAAITETPEHDIWALTLGDNHLIRIRNRKVIEEIPLDQKLTYADNVVPAGEGSVWISDRDGKIARYRAGQLQIASLSDDAGHIPIREITADGDSALWIATTRGLYYRNDSGTIVLNSKNGLPCDSIYSVVQDNHGSMWLYAQCGLVKVEAPQLGKWRQQPGSRIEATLFDARDGAYPGSLDQNQRISGKAADGRLWFTNDIVVQSIDPEHPVRNEVVPPVTVEGVIADRKLLPMEQGVVAPPRTRDLQIDYTALSFTVPQKVRFRYKLEGHDADWQDPMSRRQAFYTDLPPGKYRFLVQASNNDGVWNEQGASLDFSVAPAWYQTAWFRILFIATVFLVLWRLYRLHVRQVTRSLALRFDERLAERTRIARDLHDTFLQTIQGSKMVADDALEAGPDAPRMRRALEQLSAWLEQAIDEGRAALNSLRIASTATNDLADGLRRATEQHVDSSMSVSMSVLGDSREMHPIVRDEIYRVGYEAIRNAQIHSKATSLQVELRYDRDLVLHVRDNGIGIDPSVAHHGKDGHFGLQGMRERAARIGAKLTILSSASGTDIALAVPGESVFLVATKKSHDKATV
jgi:signal transduction histidine kinase/ligand-binding sensor domain-containing protein